MISGRPGVPPPPSLSRLYGAGRVLAGWIGGGGVKGGILGDMLPDGAIESLIYADPMHGG